MARTAGKRQEKRIAVIYPVKLWGMDCNGRPFIEAATTLNISANGALLKNIPAKLAVGDVIGLSSGGQKCRFRIVWLGQAGTSEAGHLGLQSLADEKRIWDMELPAQSIDIYTRSQESDSRLLPRLECCLSAEVGSNTASGRVQAFVTDINLGGCYVSTSMPFTLEAKITIGLWLGERSRVCAEGIVISHHPGFGMGIKFHNLSRKNLEDLKVLIERLPKPETVAKFRIQQPPAFER